MNDKPATSNFFKIAAIILAVLLLCSLCVIAILAFFLLNNTIRINELVGKPTETTSTTSSSSAVSFNITTEDRELDEATAKYEMKGKLPMVFVNAKEIEQVTDEVNQLVGAVRKELSTGETAGDFGKSTFNVDYDVYFSMNRYVSVVLSGDQYYAGAAHPTPFKYSINFDLERNKIIELRDFLTLTQFKKLADYAFQELRTRPEMVDLETLKTGTSASENNYRVWYLQDDNVVVYFSVYQVASYAAGDFEVPVPLSELD